MLGSSSMSMSNSSGGGIGNGNGNGNGNNPPMGMTIPKEETVTPNPPGILRDPMVPMARKMNTDIPEILPHERVFPIQIGSELFRLSGASLSSDAPSYFSQFFQCQLRTAEENGDDSNAVRTLYIDRDPVTFRDISLHLQGYHVAPRDGSHFVKLFADAQFYSLPRLISQLYEERIFISIGNRDFHIPREVFSDPGNSPNYFSLGFAVFFSTPSEVFPGLNREGLLRPPSIIPPAVPNRSADIFAELLHLLRGYPLRIKSEDHRAELLRDCRYFHLKGLEQKLIRHSISFNLTRHKDEITLRLEDIQKSGISVVSDTTPLSPDLSLSSSPPTVKYVNYARPFVDTKSYELVVEIGGECMKLHFSPPSSPAGQCTLLAEFFGEGKRRISRLFEVTADKLNMPTTQPLGLLMKRGGASSQPASPGNTPLNDGDLVRVVLGDDAAVCLDGREWYGDLSGNGNASATANREENYRKRKRTEEGMRWIVKTGQWRLRVQSINRNTNPINPNLPNTNLGNGGLGGIKNSSNLSNANAKINCLHGLNTSFSGNRGLGVECVLVAVKIDAVTGELGRNAQRAFLGT